MQYPQPLHTSSCTTTVPNSVRNSAPVGHTSRQAACVQCLHTSEDISQRTPPSPDSVAWSSPCGGSSEGRLDGMPRSTAVVEVSVGFSTKATCRQVLAPSSWVLS